MEGLQPMRLSSKTLPGVGGGQEFDKGQDFVENEIETSKNGVDQIFTSENNNKKAIGIFDRFRGLLHVFSQ